MITAEYQTFLILSETLSYTANSIINPNKNKKRPNELSILSMQLRLMGLLLTGSRKYMGLKN
ncbi:hypothetical protein LAP8965_03069 [Lactiplantibacillus plantarum]|nr:hypothetical protein LAP8963_03008 [Lactiplantibacillus plantarum]SPE13574.1 hypothetical protein LAP8964_02966 [Lactiplantibacillus plantarum]SPH08033.1 hypothetical protein LAP8965_03069 [Lactiplantibacillus plantarum]SPH10782.1 hypothetical protein LAP8966_02994 [Lactiplantibacillus plantarum]